MSFSLLVLIAIFIIILTHYLWIWSYWIRRGVKGPRGIPFLGVMHLTQSYDFPLFRWLIDWTKQYGTIYGITEGTAKILVVSDPEIIHEVFVKQFDNFYGRKLNPIQGDPNQNKRVHLVDAEGHRWKRLRNFSSPTFSNKNLKKIMSTVEESVTEVMRFLDKDGAGGKTLNILEYYQEFTMDIIGKIAMGQTESIMFKNPLLPKVKMFFGDGSNRAFFISGMFPVIGTIFHRLFSLFPTLQPDFEMMDMIEKAVNARIEQRKADERSGIEVSGKPQDFIDLFLDARADVDFFDQEAKDDFAKTRINKVDKNLTLDEIVGQLNVFLLAGYDTTALSLSYTSFLLATHPEVQKKVQEEVDRECPDPEVTFDQLSKLKYMECVVKEALRVYPLASQIHNRKCLKATTVCGIQIDEGTYVMVDTWTMQNDPKIWGDDVKEFKPERWESGDEQFFQKGGYLPFGLGPRICIGMRLALMEEKMLLTQILKKYTFETCSETVTPLDMVGRATISPRTLNMKLKPRHFD